MAATKAQDSAKVLLRALDMREAMVSESRPERDPGSGGDQVRKC